MSQNLKVYILIRDSIPAGLAINSVAHGILMLEEKYKDDPTYQDWRKNSFRKVTCKVNDLQYTLAKKQCEHVEVTESARGGEAMLSIFKPADTFPKLFKHLPLYK